MTDGFIGLGKMGRGMASNLQTKGFPLMVFDVVERVAALEALGAKRGSIQEIAAACDIVVTVLPTGKEVERGDPRSRRRAGPRQARHADPRPLHHRPRHHRPPA